MNHPTLRDVADAPLSLPHDPDRRRRAMLLLVGSEAVRTYRRHRFSLSVVAFYALFIVGGCLVAGAANAIGSWVDAASSSSQESGR